MRNTLIYTAGTGLFEKAYILNSKEEKSQEIYKFYSSKDWRKVGKLSFEIFTCRINLYAEINTIEDFKKINGARAFPISLQQRELGVFVDRIRKEYDAADYSIRATKHDRVICPMDDQDQGQSNCRMDS